LDIEFLKRIAFETGVRNIGVFANVRSLIFSNIFSKSNKSAALNLLSVSTKLLSYDIFFQLTS